MTEKNKSLPYIDEEFERLVPRAKTALSFFKKTNKASSDYDSVKARFISFMEYFLDQLEPVEKMNVIVDIRAKKQFDPKAGDIFQDKNGKVHEVTEFMVRARRERLKK